MVGWGDFAFGKFVLQRSVLYNCVMQICRNNIKVLLGESTIFSFYVQICILSRRKQALYTKRSSVTEKFKDLECLVKLGSWAKLCRDLGIFDMYRYAFELQLPSEQMLSSSQKLSQNDKRSCK